MGGGMYSLTPDKSQDLVNKIWRMHEKEDTGRLFTFSKEELLNDVNKALKELIEENNQQPTGE